MAVDAYSREFENLARYATEEVSTDAKKQARFRKGLNPKLRRDLHLHHCNTFHALVNKAINAETAQLTYDESRKNILDLGSSSGSSSQKRRIWVPNSVLPPSLHRGHLMWYLFQFSSMLHPGLLMDRLPMRVHVLPPGFATSAENRDTLPVFALRPVLLHPSQRNLLDVINHHAR